MVKPEDIPQDIWVVAETHVGDRFLLGARGTTVELIARAILAEREKWTNGSQVQIPVSREQAGLMISVAESYLKG